jgi:hypothetical protein
VTNKIAVKELKEKNRKHTNHPLSISVRPNVRPNDRPDRRALQTPLYAIEYTGGEIFAN